MPRKITRGYLENGVQVNCFGDRISYVSNIGCNVGAVDDPVGRTGFWHLDEHLLARQARTITPREMHLLFRKYAGWGEGESSDLNVCVDHVSLSFGHGYLIYAGHMEILMKILAQAFRDRYIDLKGLKSEKSAIHTETLIFGDDIPLDLLQRELYGLVYKSNPIRRRIDSELSDLASIHHPSQLIRAADKFLIPTRTFINIFGPSHRESLKLADKLLGDWQVGGVPTVEWTDTSANRRPIREQRVVVGYDGSDNDPILKTRVERICIKHDLKCYYLGIAFPIPVGLRKYQEIIELMSSIAAFEAFETMRTENLDFNTGVYRLVPIVDVSFLHGVLYFWTASASWEGILLATGRINS